MGGSSDISLSTEEHEVLTKYFRMRFKLDDMERQRLYFRGHTDCISYLKTVFFWTSLLLANLSAQYAFISGFCSSGYDFAIPSSRLHLTAQTLEVAFGSVTPPGGLAPQSIGMPVIRKEYGENDEHSHRK